MSGILIVRLRGQVNVRHDVKLTLESLNLHRVNHATIVPATPEYMGMVRKVKDHVTFGTVSVADAERLLKGRGRVVGDQPLTDAFVKDNTDYSNIADFAEALATGKTKLGVGGIRPVLRLSPPKKGHEGIKHSFTAGGALGDRGDKIGALVERMV